MNILSYLGLSRLTINIEKVVYDVLIANAFKDNPCMAKLKHEIIFGKCSLIIMHVFILSII